MKSIITAQDLPSWYEKSEFIYGGYRNPLTHSTLYDCASSIFTWHNETLNIHTHLWSAISFPMIFWWFTQQDFYQTLSPLAKACVINGVIGPILMGLTSAFAHTFFIINKEWYDFSWRIDMVGIVTVLYSHLIADIYIITVLLYRDFRLFYCLAALSLLFGIYCIRKVFVENQLVTYAITYGFVGSVPFTSTLFYLAFSSPYNYALRTAATLSLSCSVSCVIAVSFFFIGKIPERYWPHTVVKSHALHHIFITIGVYCALGMVPYITSIEALT